MLCLTRRPTDPGIVIEGPSVVRVLSVRGNHVRLGITADDGVNIVREELLFDLDEVREIEGLEPEGVSAWVGKESAA